MTPVRRHVFTGSPFETAAGYCRAVAEGDFCFVSGTTGYDYATMTMPESVTAQTENVVATLKRALEELGFALGDVVRVQYFVTDAAYADEVFAVVGRVFADIRPTAGMYVTGLIRPEMKIEIEATAMKRRDAGGARL